MAERVDVVPLSDADIQIGLLLAVQDDPTLKWRIPLLVRSVLHTPNCIMSVEG
jgi:hypothetical protein